MIFSVGHSLGAHICGYAGRHFTSLTNKVIPRITGMVLSTHRKHIFMRYLYSNLIYYNLQVWIQRGKCVYV